MSSKLNLIYFLSVLRPLIRHSNAFNIDTTSPWLIERNQSTVDFGYSIALNTNSDIFIGSPRSDYDRGTIYKCNYSKNHQCQEILINEKIEDFETKKLGSVIAISNNGELAITAPGSYQNFFYRGVDPSKPKPEKPKLAILPNRMNTGLIYTFDSNTDNTKINNPNTIIPCNSKQISPDCQRTTDGCSRSHCVSGLDIKFLRDESTVVSLPGAYYSQGTVERYKHVDPNSNQYKVISKGFEYKFLRNDSSHLDVKDRISNSNYRKFLHQSNLPQFFIESEASEALHKKRKPYQNTYDSNFLGSSIDVLNGNYLAAGVPARYQFNQLGAVVIRKITETNDDIYQINGESVGERFGYVVLSHDFDQDGLDDLLIGAPMYTNKTCIDCGRVYYYKQVGPNTDNFKLQQILEPNPEIADQARFGFSLGFLGNIDTLPGDEVQIGMPTADKNYGAITVISYNLDQDQFTESQIIKGRDIYPDLTDNSKYFGLSVMNNMQDKESPFNIDGLNQGDVIVGSNNEVSVLFTRKVITMAEGYPNIKFPINEIDLTPENFNCKREQSENGANNAMCYTMTLEIDVGSNQSINTRVNMNITLDSLLQSTVNRRLKFEDTNNPDIVIDPTSKSTATLTFRSSNKIKILCYIIPSNVEDYTTPIKVDTATFLTSIGDDSWQNKRRKRATSELTPVLNPASASKSKVFPIKNNCQNKICQANVLVKAQHKFLGNNDYLVVDLPESQSLQVEINLKNIGEDAWNSNLVGILPEGVALNSNGYELCSFDSSEENVNKIICPIGDFGMFKAGQEKNLVLKFEVNNVNGASDSYDLAFKMTSRSELKDGKKNSALVALPVKIQSDIGIDTPIAEPEYYALDFRKNQPLTKQINHTYVYRNNGPSKISSYKINIWMPIQYVQQETFGSKFNNPDDNLIDLLDKDSMTVYKYESNTDEYLVSCDDGVVIDYSKNKNIIIDENNEGYKAVKPEKLDCKTNRINCKKFTCYFEEELDVNDEIELKIVSDYFTKATQKLGKTNKISSITTFKVSNYPYSIKYDQSFPSTEQFAITTLNYDAPAYQEAINPRWLLIAALIATIFFILLVLCLMKTGFFKRHNYHNQDAHMMHTATKSNIGSEHARTQAEYYDRARQQPGDRNESTQLLR